MSDMITVTDPGWDWSFWPWVGAGVAAVGFAALMCLLIARLSSTRSVADRWEYAFKVVGIIALCSIGAGAGASAIISASFYGARVDNAKQEGMWDLGYHDIEFDKNDDYIFTAYRDGKYVKGVAIEVVPLTWQVIELDIPDENR